MAREVLGETGGVRVDTSESNNLEAAEQESTSDYNIREYRTRQTFLGGCSVRSCASSFASKCNRLAGIAGIMQGTMRMISRDELGTGIAEFHKAHDLPGLNAEESRARLVEKLVDSEKKLRALSMRKFGGSVDPSGREFHPLSFLLFFFFPTGVTTTLLTRDNMPSGTDPLFASAALPLASKNIARHRFPDSYAAILNLKFGTVCETDRWKQLRGAANGKRAYSSCT